MLHQIKAQQFYTDLDLLSTVLSPTENSRIQGLFKASEWFSSTFQTRFNFQGLFKKTSKFKYFSSLWEPCRPQQPPPQFRPSCIPTSLSNLPGLLTAGSRAPGRLVAAMTTTPLSAFSPSSNIRSWPVSRDSCTPLEPTFRGHKASISSMNNMHGTSSLTSLAFSKTFLKFDSVSPGSEPNISGPFTEIRNVLKVLATYRTTDVFPQPGGPCNKIPRGGSIPRFWNCFLCSKGSLIKSSSMFTTEVSPPIFSPLDLWFNCSKHSLLWTQSTITSVPLSMTQSPTSGLPDSGLKSRTAIDEIPLRTAYLRLSQFTI